MVDAILGGLLVIPVRSKHAVTSDGQSPVNEVEDEHNTYTVPPSNCFLRLGSGGSGMPYFSRRSAARSRYFICGESNDCWRCPGTLCDSLLHCLCFPDMQRGPKHRMP